MGQVIVLPDVLDRLNDLVAILHNKGYFSFRENAVDYVAAISAFIYTIPDQRQRPTKNLRHGAFYCRYKPNKNTTWYVTFDREGERHIVKNLINNHTSDYPAFIRDL